jgi:hypothetical protein
MNLKFIASKFSNNNSFKKNNCYDENHRFGQLVENIVIAFL